MPHLKIDALKACIGQRKKRSFLAFRGHFHQEQLLHGQLMHSGKCWPFSTGSDQSFLDQEKWSTLKAYRRGQSRDEITIQKMARLDKREVRALKNTMHTARLTFGIMSVLWHGSSNQESGTLQPHFSRCRRSSCQSFINQFPRPPHFNFKIFWLS